jgi:hypothetical protein
LFVIVWVAKVQKIFLLTPKKAGFCSHLTAGHADFRKYAQFFMRLWICKNFYVNLQNITLQQKVFLIMTFIEG